MPKYWKEAKGFVLSPLVPCGVFALLATGAGLFSAIRDGVEINPFTYLFGGLIWFISALPVAYSATLILGIPGYILYRKKDIVASIRCKKLKEIRKKIKYDKLPKLDC